MSPENVSEAVNHQLVLGQKLRISLLGLVSYRLDDFKIQVGIARDKFPKSLSAKLDIISLMLAFSWLLSVAATIDAFRLEAAFVLGINLPRFVEGGSKLFNLLAVGPIRA